VVEVITAVTADGTADTIGDKNRDYRIDEKFEAASIEAASVILLIGHLVQRESFTYGVKYPARQSFAKNCARICSAAFAAVPESMRCLIS
jgi:hypothetical protein